MGDRGMFTGLYHHNMYTKVSSELIKYHLDDLDFYGKVENLGFYSVEKSKTNFAWSGISVGPSFVENFLSGG